MGNAMADFDDDGDLDWFISSIDVAEAGNALYINDGDANLTDEALPRGVQESYFSWGSVAFDYDNDMDEDLFVVNGSFNPVYINKPAVLFENDGNGYFTEVASARGANVISEGRGAGYLDIDRDGYLDLYVTNSVWTGYEPASKTNFLLQAQGNGNHYLRFKFNDSYSGNSEQLGAWVTVIVGGIEQLREVTGGSNYLSQSEQFVHFGMSQYTQADEVHIRLNDGRQMVLTDVPADQMVVIEVPPKGSYDGDADLDLIDFAALQRCFTGDGVPVTDIDCLTFDFDFDSDVDGADLAAFQGRVTGPN